MTPPSSTASPPPSTATDHQHITASPPPSTATDHQHIAMPPPSTIEAPAADPPSTATPALFATACTCTCTAGLVVIALVVRLLTFVFLLISLIIITTDTVTYDDGFGLELEAKFNDFYAYRYMLSSIVIGFTYTLVQIAFTIFQVSTGNRVGGDTNMAMFHLDFYGDKVISYMLATGAAAGFGLTVDLNRFARNDLDTDFLDKAIAASSLLLVGFLFSAVSSVVSSLALRKKG
ncbi:hypothetical protein ACH5RR_016639 [Cinchona calisaya]|uniref:CASP-like protein n=1 Tax=Cinchona calisaya TaxID=153742 RepID=A0ABD2ZWF5_9GENT